MLDLENVFNGNLCVSRKPDGERDVKKRDPPSVHYREAWGGAFAIVEHSDEVGLIPRSLLRIMVVLQTVARSIRAEEFARP